MSIISLASIVASEHETRDPFAICQNLGIIVRIHPLADCRGYYMRAFDQHYITIAIDLPYWVRLFVCAHELAHFLLHQRINRVFWDYRTYMEPTRFELEADKFAAHLLFGEPPLYQDVALTSRDMANILHVPVEQVDYRLIELGIYH